MDERPANSKSKDKRLEEKEKLEAELERSMAVARMKQAHKIIEDTEKSRKRSAMLSICKRIGNLASNANVFSGILLKAEGENPVTQGTVFGGAVESVVKIYESIRYDMQKTLDINDQDFEKLFPRMEVKTRDCGLACSSLMDMCDQLMDMRIYCERTLQ